MKSDAAPHFKSHLKRAPPRTLSFGITNIDAVAFIFRAKSEYHKLSITKFSINKQWLRLFLVKNISGTLNALFLCQRKSLGSGTSYQACFIFTVGKKKNFYCSTRCISSLSGKHSNCLQMCQHQFVAVIIFLLLLLLFHVSHL